MSLPCIFILKLRELDDEIGVYHRLRRALKTLLRRDKLRCLSIEETAAGTDLPVSLKKDYLT
jgi:hypothetical protein